MKDDPVFLTVGEVLGLHSDQIREFGGAEGIRDQGALESAVAQASTTYDGEYLHNGLFEMARPPCGLSPSGTGLSCRRRPKPVGA